MMTEKQAQTVVNHLKFYVELFIRESLSSTKLNPLTAPDMKQLWINWDEAYKEENYPASEGLRAKDRTPPYGEIVLAQMKQSNLVNYWQRRCFEQALKKEQPENRKGPLPEGTLPEQLEKALSDLYDRADDPATFRELQTILGGQFDLLSFLFFLKDKDRYLPVRSRIFDGLFRRLGINSRLENHCSWETYQQYMSWMEEIRGMLSKLLKKPVFSLLDAHCFLWILPQLDIFAPYPEEILEKSSSDAANGDSLTEGGRKLISVNVYERNYMAVRKCKQEYLRKQGKLTCQICGFDFGDVYGETYANLIHVHHIEPVSKKPGKYVINPKKDLLPVCPNCHMVLHAKNGITVEDLKQRVEARRKACAELRSDDETATRHKTE